tara:strand:- start:740 stop:910 length:171 start_codon:yes stop_codon:yes gene_type:complete
VNFAAEKLFGNVERTDNNREVFPELLHGDAIEICTMCFIVYPNAFHLPQKINIIVT